MRHPVGVWLGVIPLLLGVISCAALQAESVHREPVEHVYASPVGSPLKAYVFSPEKPGEGRRSAIVLIHGGGWTMGDPRWAFSGARHFAERGMVAIAAQYRLSDQKNITPIEAMEDVRAVIRWMRVNADSLGIDPQRIAAYGRSAGAHLAVSAAILDRSDTGTSSPGRRT